jgi:hypothetical protein
VQILFGVICGLGGGGLGYLIAIVMYFGLGMWMAKQDKL